MDYHAKHYQELEKYGIIKVECPYSQETLNRWNKLLDPLFENQVNTGESRNYVKLDQLYSLGIFEEFFNPSMKNLIRYIMPDAVLYHFHSYETLGQNQLSHTADFLGDGWHQDGDALGILNPVAPHYLTVFIYLSDVLNPDNGPFEFLPEPPTSTLKFKNGLNSVQVLGKIGTTFIFNRSFYHRAVPNRSSVKRRILKASIQPYYLNNPFIIDEPFTRVRQALAHKNDQFLDFILLGKYYEQNVDLISLKPLPLNSKVNINYSLKFYKEFRNELSKKMVKPLKNFFVNVKAYT